jgi:hypothetical protein
MPIRADMFPIRSADVRNSQIFQGNATNDPAIGKVPTIL